MGARPEGAMHCKVCLRHYMLFSVTVKVKMGLQSHQTLLAANPLKLPLNRNQLERRERMHRQPLLRPQRPVSCTPSGEIGTSEPTQCSMKG